MNITAMANIMVSFFIVYYIRFFIMLIPRSKRKAIVIKNEKLEELRSKKVKTVKEQLALTYLKEPPRLTKFKFSWKATGLIIWNIIYMLALFMGIRYLLYYFNIYFKLWQALSILLFGPVVVNIILSKFKLNSDDWRVYFR